MSPADKQADLLHSKALPALLVKMLGERREMLVLFHKLAEHKPFTQAEPLRRLLQAFCQVLMDYLALGHFEVYQGLEEHAGDPESLRFVERLATELYPRIAATTEVAVDFNDRYDAELYDEDLEALDRDLSRLGQALAERIELEDRLIAAIADPAQG
ncbi:MAG TPA: Rsd/AlgQ family anti-sigma factor [Candidatus Competibacteraceae bacterium]|nr:Rsd/AlgQ family anti-sigma factor [Candidatus Competibacteraceae bacterium]